MLNGLSFLVGPLQRFLDFLQRERHFSDRHNQQQEADRRDALEAILEALIRTRRYIEGLPEGHNRDEEYKLAELWAIASIRCRKSVESFGPELLDKAEHWLSAIRFPRNVLVEKGIDIETIENKFRQLVKKE